MFDLEPLGLAWTWTHEMRAVYTRNRAHAPDDAIECNLYLSVSGEPLLQCTSDTPGRIIWGATEWQP
jgi:hypothetical protein